MTPLVAAATDYLNRGLAIIALTGKTPNVSIHRQGLNQPLEGAVQTADDEALVERVFTHPDTTGVGLLTRWPFVVVDIDGEDGAKQYVELVGTALLPNTWIARTGRGLHLWFMTGIETGTVKLGPKLDLKGNGGYVAAPPSAHPDTGKEYEWLAAPGDDPFPAILPPDIEAILDRRAREMEALRTSRQAMTQLGGTFVTRDGEVFKAHKWDGLLRALRDKPEGGRNGMLYFAAMSMLQEGAGDEDLEELRQAALDAGLTDEETKRTIRSAGKALSD